MKKSILVLTTVMFIFAGGLAFTSCCNGEKTIQQEEGVSYSCPMHHYITGKKGDKCSECGMDLTSDKTEFID